MKKFAIIYGKELEAYDLGHVLTRDRYGNFMDLFERTLGTNPLFDVVPPELATDEDLIPIHSLEYIQRMERCESRDPHDTPLTPSFIRAARYLAGAGKRAANLVGSGEYEKAFVVGGGVQHAGRDREKGFGVFSDVGVCVETLRQSHGAERVLILDTDAHFGDGIHDIFLQDPSVLYISLHQDPRTLYPGTGFLDEIGEGPGRGYSVPVPLPPGSGDQVYLTVLREIFAPLAHEFDPEAILLVDGSDPHFTDRITQMGLSLRGLQQIGETVGRAAEEICQGRVVDFIGSGYSSDLNIVSMGWLASISGVTGIGLDVHEDVPLGLTDRGVVQVQEIVRAVSTTLSPFWRCFCG